MMIKLRLILEGIKILTGKHTKKYILMRNFNEKNVSFLPVT